MLELMRGLTIEVKGTGQGIAIHDEWTSDAPGRDHAAIEPRIGVSVGKRGEGYDGRRLKGGEGGSLLFDEGVETV